MKSNLNALAARRGEKPVAVNRVAKGKCHGFMD
jgi:hypothetical protein